MKIYDDDPEVYARTSKIKYNRTKGQIDGILAQFKVKDVHWHNDREHNDVFVQFILTEKFGKEHQNVTVKLSPPAIWHKDKKGERINWDVSIRNLFWYIRTHLSQAYVHQSSVFQEFLPHILNREGRKIIDVVRNQYLALPERHEKNVTPMVNDR